MDFNIPQDAMNEMQGAMQGERIELPFFAPTVWWMNGQNNQKQLVKVNGPAPYFGGWAANADELELAPDIPPSFVKATLTNRQGQEYDVYTTRLVSVAVIAKRQKWVVDDTGRGKSHVNLLCYLASASKEKGYTPWGPVVLSGKSLSGKKVLDALSDFEKRTRTLRAQAKGIPAWFFYATLGTFGDKPVQEMAGKGDKQSPITPCQVWLPDTITEDNLKSWFVGEDIAAAMMEFKHQAKDWLEDWKKPDQAQQAQPEPELTNYTDYPDGPMN